MIKIVKIYTDGSCLQNPGPGGWCSILIYKENEKIVSGNQENTTNNQMELKAVIEGLKSLNQKCEVLLYTDSAYIVNAINKNWISTWTKNNFKKIKNVSLWKELISLLSKHKVTFIKVQAHADDEYNNRCDQIARQRAKELL